MRNLNTTLVALLISVSVFSQKFSSTSQTKLSVTGTSTLHDWECVADTQEGAITAVIESDAVTQITDFNFSIKAKSLKSGKSGMDKKTWEALKADDHATITYKGSSVKIANGEATFTGKMTMAGVTKTITTTVKVTYENGKIKLSGSKAFKLTDFGIDPPKALMGTIKTGNDVAIHYNIELQKQ